MFLRKWVLMKKVTHRQQGFSLVELAIVLVIISLVVGGVLKGVELVNNSKIHSVSQDFDTIVSGYYKYRSRTHSIAGDSDSDSLADSDAQFWADLRAEKFIRGSGEQGPSHAFGGVFTLAVAVTNPGDGEFDLPSVCANAIPSEYALVIDTRIDDGSPLTGNVRTTTFDNTSNSYLDSGLLIALCQQLK